MFTSSGLQPLVSAYASRITYHEQPSMRSSLGRKSNEESSTGVPKRAVIRGKRTRCPFCFTLLTFSKPKGIKRSLAHSSNQSCAAMQFWAGAPFTAPCSFGKNANPFAVLQHAGSALQSRSVSTASFDGKAPTLEITMPKKPLPARNKESRAIRRTHPLGRTERNMMITSRYE